MALGVDGNVCRSLLVLLALGCGAVSGPGAKFGMSVFSDATSLPLSFLMRVSGPRIFLRFRLPRCVWPLMAALLG